MNEELEKLVDELKRHADNWHDRWRSLHADALPSGIYPEAADVDTQAMIANAAHANGMATAYLYAANMARRLLQES